MPAKITKLHEDKPRSPWPYMPGPHDPSRDDDYDDAASWRREPLSNTALGLLLLLVVMVSVPWLLGIVWLVERMAP